MSITFGIQDAKIAARTGPDTYGTAVDVPNIQLMGVTLRVISAEGTGDDRIVVVAARAIAGQMQVRMQGVPLDVLEIVTGVNAVDVGTPVTSTSLAIPGGQRMPAFGIVGQGLEEEGLGDQLIFVPNAKVTSDITLSTMEYGTLSQVEFTAMAIDDDDYGIINLIERVATGAFTLPPTEVSD